MEYVFDIVAAKANSAYSSPGGGSGGTIRDAGGAFGKREARNEEEYFHRKQKEQLAALRKHLEEEVQYRKDEIVRHRVS
ncbi:ATPase inhibitor, mitochondrial [Paragonimus westermani]|uniref:ATP synthase F1 subunit epsilon n=1 Tax=Paragonimus westermani TaxID=34504 RepID=A0A5J4NMN9_9TREM|nr:ATPase inhibitor, mitochondrial [Paragonimus westermani]